MGPNSNPLELTLSLKPTYVPKSLNIMLSDLNEKIHNPLEKLIVLNDYIQKHKEELAWVETLETRELPQCMLLLMDAIDALKEEMGRIIRNLGANECDEPEFETWKKKRYEELLEETSISKKYLREGKEPVMANSPPAYSGNPKTDLDATDYKDRVSLQLRYKTYGCEFSEKGNEPSQTGFPCDLNKEAGDQAVMYQPQLIPFLQPTWKNNRRNWTPELHTRFVEALNFLGGPQVATPKQIKDCMKVEGLTNDQVKSHLQKYRLNLRGPIPPGGDANSSSAYDHQPLLQYPWMTPSRHLYCRNFLRPVSISCHSNSLQQQQQQQQLEALRNAGVGFGSSTGGSNIRDNAETSTKK